MASYNGYIPNQMINKQIQKTFVAFALLIGLVLPLRSASAAGGEALPAFSGFVATVMDGETNVVRGVYVPGVLALRVMQQPADDPESVLRMDGVVTQFGEAALNHVIGLLAHDDLAGVSFSNLRIGQEVRIVYGDGRVEYYMVNRLARFQAPQPGSRDKNYVDLDSNIPYTAQDIFSMFYDGDVHVTFQTCILQDGNSSWGRLFVTAIPIPAMPLQEYQTFMLGARLDINTIGVGLERLVGDGDFR